MNSTLLRSGYRGWLRYNVMDKGVSKEGLKINDAVVLPCCPDSTISHVYVFCFSESRSLDSDLIYSKITWKSDKYDCLFEYNERWRFIMIGGVHSTKAIEGRCKRAATIYVVPT
jgi:hypothetical protein